MGLTTPPCGVPRVLPTRVPSSSSIGAVSHLSIYSKAHSHFTCLRTARSNSVWLMLSNRPRISKFAPVPLQNLHRSYGSIRPSAPHRYSRLVASTTCASPFALKRLVPAVPTESLCQLPAPFPPVAASPVLRSPAGSSQRFPSPLVLTTP